MDLLSMMSSAKRVPDPVAEKAKGLQIAIEAAGGQRALARAIGVSQSTLSEWVEVGQIPAHRVVQVEAVTGVKREKLRPDLYRH